MRAVGEQDNALDVQSIVQQAVQDYLHSVPGQIDPAYEAELARDTEAKRRMQLERRVNELVEENRAARIANKK